MPDDYYVSQYSGEEIDALLGGAGAGTVRYDAAQSLTDAQKTQARANIAAAPDGFGLGKRNVILTASDDLDNVMGNGWYYWGSSTPANAPALINANSSSDYCAMFMISGSQIVASFNDRNNMAMRSKNIDGWTPWEYINPPLNLGVEYRTTERYAGKPVYVKAVDCGQCSDGKEVEHGISNIDFCVYAQGLMSGMALPRVIVHDLSNEWSAYISQVSATKIRFECGTSSVGNNISVILKYTKTTD